MSDPTELRELGLRATLPRLKILELFRVSDRRHLTAEQVHRIMLENDSECGLGTVYRVLTQLREAGVLKRSRIDSSKAVYELNDGEHHDHLLCEDCGHMCEFRDDQIEERQRQLAARCGFELVGHVHVLRGRCKRKNCKGGSRSDELPSSNPTAEL